MPITSSAKKAVRVAQRRLQENLVRKAAVKQTLKQIRKSLQTDNDKKIGESLTQAQSALDRAVKSKLLHRNTASRLFSRLVKKTNAHGVSVPKVKGKKAKA